MAKFNAQNTDAENAKGLPKVTNRGGVKLVSARSAQDIANDDPRDTGDGKDPDTRNYRSRNVGSAVSATIK